ncbi:MAG TPA: hypothetical protein VMU04_03850 [Candidatus Acidoferrum sp.]|nr:hypothetical protein [Candidatus Acidoferrum sp.]
MVRTTNKRLFPSFINPTTLLLLSSLTLSLRAGAEESAAPLPNLPVVNARLGSARVTTHDGLLEVTTGKVARRWKWTGAGLVTVSLRDEQSGKEWAKSQPARASDWDLPGAIGDDTPGQLLSLTANTDDDQGFTSKHLEVLTTVRYPDARLEIQHLIWVYPGATGIRTQLRARALTGFSHKGLPDKEGVRKDSGHTIAVPSARADYLPLDFAVKNQRRYWGYFNDPGNRHDQSRDMLREEVITGFPIFLDEDEDWASGVSVEYGDGGAGVCVVKESPKCVNQPGHYTGSFYAGPPGLAVTGWGLTPSEILTNRFRDCWATWSIVFGGGNDGLQLALKEFDRTRYPVFPQRDLFLMANTWGPANPGGAQFTTEKFVLDEIPALADLGVEVLQIDDGWQKSGGGPGASNFLPNYTNGWRDIKAQADRYHLRLGLWVSIRNARAEDLEQDLDELGCVTWKVDFDHLASRTDYESREATYRQLMKHAWMKTQFCLCPEYEDPRYGWYYDKQFGSIYFQNVQESLPAHLTMVPYQVLRQHWLMARYFNANKLQVMLQNPKRANPSRSDAPLYSHAYCFAMGLPFVPVFFQSAQFLDAPGHDELQRFIRLYKQHREAIFSSYTFPIGDKPDNANWSGFQTYSPDRTTDYLLLFRELHNQQPQRALRLMFLSNQTATLTNLETGENRTVQVPADGTLPFEIPQAAGYRFLQYTHSAKSP